MAIVITDRMYVGFQERKNFKTDETTTLGFATYVENNKAFEKRSIVHNSKTLRSMRF